MISNLHEKMPGIDWKMGDSYYEGFYVRGRTKHGIKIKIAQEDEPGKYFLGIYFYGTNHVFGPVRKMVVDLVLRWRIMRAIGVKRRTEDGDLPET
jgi:hypothetical protein